MHGRVAKRSNIPTKINGSPPKEIFKRINGAETDLSFVGIHTSHGSMLLGPQICHWHCLI